MGLHPEFPKSPYSELLPDQRWFPAAEELRSTAYEKLLPPLVAKIRSEITAWRDAGYSGASDTSRALLIQWFETEHMVEQADGTPEPVVYGRNKREPGRERTNIPIRIRGSKRLRAQSAADLRLTCYRLYRIPGGLTR